MVLRGKVDPERPLPDRISKEYWELFAKRVLEYFYPDRFKELAAGDRPDLYNSAIGVEVTSAENRVAREIDSLHSRGYTYGDEKERESAAKRIRKLGGIIGDYYLIHPSYDRDLGRIYDAVKTKTCKLNKNYRFFNENDLFIRTTDIVLDEELPEVLSRITACMSEYTKKYDSVFVCCLGGELYEFDINRNLYKCACDSWDVIQQLMMDVRKAIDSKYS